MSNIITFEEYKTLKYKLMYEMIGSLRSLRGVACMAHRYKFGSYTNKELKGMKLEDKRVIS